MQVNAEKKYTYDSQVWVSSTHLFGVYCSKPNYSHEEFRSRWNLQNTCCSS